MAETSQLLDSEVWAGLSILLAFVTAAVTVRLIALHGGTVELHSVVDQGTKAICRLPTTTLPLQAVGAA